jgi:outer membrane protein assembly factor BamB
MAWPSDCAEIAWNYTSYSDEVFFPLVRAGSLVVFSTPFSVNALRISGGKVAWSQSGSGYSAVGLSPDAVTVFVLTAQSVIALSSVSGTQLWTNGIVHPETAYPPVATPSIVSFIEKGGRIMGLERTTGNTMWVMNVNCSDELSRLSYSEGALLASCGTSFYRIDEATGRTLWTSPVRAVYLPVVIGNYVFSLTLTSRDPHLTCNLSKLDVRTGVQEWSVYPGDYQFASPTSGPHGTVIVPWWYRNSGHHFTGSGFIFVSAQNGSFVNSFFNVQLHDVQRHPRRHHLWKLWGHRRLSVREPRSPVAHRCSSICWSRTAVATERICSDCR